MEDFFHYIRVTWFGKQRGFFMYFTAIAKSIF